MNEHHRILALALMFAVILPALVPVADGQSLSRGSRFTVTVTGLPNTPYYVWLTGTSTMTGERYDQPPVIVGGTMNLVKDPEGGPYTIGSYRYYNGGGLTILDDVAPSSSTMSNTNYYAQVMTDERGTAVVEFQTSAYTAIRHYSVKVENPAAPESTNLQVQERVFNRGSGPMIITPATTFETTVITETPTPTPTPTPVPVVTTEATPVPTTTPLPTTTRKAPVETALVVIAAGAMVLARGRR